MPLSLTFPATSENYTIIGRLSNDNNLAAIRATSFSLRKASDGSLVSRSVTIGSATRADDGSYYWDITVTNNDSYDGLVYVQIAAFSFWDSVASTVVPRSALDSNQFQYNTMAVPAPAAPSNFSGSATDTTIRFTWDTTPGKNIRNPTRFKRVGRCDITTPSHGVIAVNGLYLRGKRESIGINTRWHCCISYDNDDGYTHGARA